MCGEICNAGANASQTGDHGNRGDEEFDWTATGRTEASVALQLLPWVAMDEAYGIIDRVIDYIKSTNVRYMVGPFETTMEGELDLLLDIVKKAQHIAIESGAPEVISMVKISYRPDEAGCASIASKVAKYRQKEKCIDA